MSYVLVDSERVLGLSSTYESKTLEYNCGDKVPELVSVVEVMMICRKSVFELSMAIILIFSGSWCIGWVCSWYAVLKKVTKQELQPHRKPLRKIS